MKDNFLVSRLHEKTISHTLLYYLVPSQSLGWTCSDFCCVSWSGYGWGAPGGYGWSFDLVWSPARLFRCGEGCVVLCSSFLWSGSYSDPPGYPMSANKVDFKATDTSKPAAVSCLNLAVANAKVKVAEALVNNSGPPCFLSLVLCFVAFVCFQMFSSIYIHCFFFSSPPPHRS